MITPSKVDGVPNIHYPALDGLRGLAILLVMTGHFTRIEFDGLAGVPFDILREAGWTGVDLFFVLSGFLITGILLRTKGKVGYFHRFYVHRALRIVPLYYFLLLMYTTVLPLVLPADNPYIPKPWIREPVWYWTFLSNFFMFNLGKFPDEVMSVSWSLAVEEQFYLVWPLVVLLCSRRRLLQCCLVIIGSAVVTRLSLFLLGANFMQMFVYTFARMDSLAVGALVAWIWTSPPGLFWYQRWRRTITTSATLALAVCYLWDAASYYFFSGSPSFRITSIILFTALSLLYGTAILHLLLNPDGAAARALSTRFFRIAGLFSFAMYLTNDTINHTLIAFGISPNDLAGGGVIGQIIYYLICYPLTFAVGWVSYHGLEKHFLKLKFSSSAALRDRTC